MKLFKSTEWLTYIEPCPGTGAKVDALTSPPLAAGLVFCPRKIYPTTRNPPKLCNSILNANNRGEQTQRHLDLERNDRHYLHTQGEEPDALCPRQHPLYFGTALRLDRHHVDHGGQGTSRPKVIDRHTLLLE